MLLRGGCRPHMVQPRFGHRQIEKYAVTLGGKRLIKRFRCLLLLPIEKLPANSLSVSQSLSPDHEHWTAARRRRFLLPVKVLSRLFRRLVLEALRKAHAADALHFFGDLDP